MALSSINRYLQGGGGDGREEVSVFERGLYLLLQALRVHSVQIGPLNRRRFQSEIADIEHRIQEAKQATFVSLGVEEAIRCLEGYNKGVGLAVQTVLDEHRKLVQELTQSIGVLSSAGAETTSELQALGKRVDSADKVEDLRALRQEFAVCTQQVCEASTRQRDDAARIISTLRGQMLQRGPQPAAGLAPAVAQAPPKDLPGAAETFGLATRTEAMAEIAAAIESHARCFAAVLVIDRFPLIVKRFGPQIVERVQALVSMELAQNVKDGDHLFTWRPGAFFVLMERMDDVAEVEAHVGTLAKLKLSRKIEVENRTVLLPLSLASNLILLYEVQSVDAAVRRIENFVTNCYNT
jgi:GGDEF domain-containing protein